MKVSELLDLLLGDQTFINIPLHRLSTRAQAEITHRFMVDNHPQFEFTLDLISGRFWLVVFRRKGATKVPYDA